MVKSKLFSLAVIFSALATSSALVEYAVVALGAASVYYLGYCRFYECCSEKWILNDFKGLSYDLQSKLHGQHIASEIFLKVLTKHLLNPNPKKALVLSLNGRTGSGKNHITNLALSRIFKLGSKSKAVKFWHSRIHFPHDTNFRRYQENIKSTIVEKVRYCSRAIFIFDESNLIPNGVIEVLLPFLDYHSDVDGLDFRKTTFMFLSNTGGNEIAETFFQSKKERETMTLEDFYPLYERGVYDEKGGANKLVDIFIPFLPLEKTHVKLCVEDDLTRHGCMVKDKFVQSVADTMEYDSTRLYSLTGCKTVDAKINAMLDEC